MQETACALPVHFPSGRMSDQVFDVLPDDTEGCFEVIPVERDPRLGYEKQLEVPSDVANPERTIEQTVHKRVIRGTTPRLE